MSNSFLYFSKFKNNIKKSNRKIIKSINHNIIAGSYRTLEILQTVPQKEREKEITHRKKVDRSKSLTFGKVVQNAPWIFLSSMVGRTHMLRHFLSASKQLL